MKEPGFGVRLKGYRMGYRHSPQHGAMIRMSTLGNRTFIELAPVNNIPNKSPVKVQLHRCWWEGEVDLLDELDWLKPVKQVRKFIAVEVDDDGNIVKELTNAT